MRAPEGVHSRVGHFTGNAAVHVSRGKKHGSGQRRRKQIKDRHRSASLSQQLCHTHSQVEEYTAKIPSSPLTGYKSWQGLLLTLQSTHFTQNSARLPIGVHQQDSWFLSHSWHPSTTGQSEKGDSGGAYLSQTWLRQAEEQRSGCFPNIHLLVHPHFGSSVSPACK